MDRWIDEYMDRWIVRQMNRLNNEYMDKWIMYKQMDRKMDICLYLQVR